MDGITVIDVTAALAGPYGAFVLGALGARVIKVENPAGGDRVRTHPPYVGAEGVSFDRDGTDGISLPFLSRGRAKESITLDLKHPDGPAVFMDLVRNADVVLENFSSGTADRLGIGYADCAKVNPRVVYCAISGFGADASSGGTPAYDMVIQALSGVMMVSGNEGDPPVRIGMPFADLIAPLFGIIGVFCALRAREFTGRGQFVDISMLGAVTSLVASEPFAVLEQMGIPTRSGNATVRLSPFGTFRTADGSVAICASNNHECGKLFAAMGQEQLIDDPRFATLDARVAHFRELTEVIEAWSGALSTEAVISVLQAARIAVAPVRGPADAVRDPRVLARGETVPLRHPRFGEVDGVYGPGIPINFSDLDIELGIPPQLGEHDELVYREVAGYSTEQIRSLRTRGVIGPERPA